MKMPLQNFSDPRVMGAACAAVDQITEMSNSVYKSVLITITGGTYQVWKLLCMCVCIGDCVFCVFYVFIHTGC